jgi:hypothetical protein
MTRAKDISKIVSDANFGGTLDVGGAFTSLGIDDNANALAMTIDSSENVFVTKTSSDVAVVGQELRSSGFFASTRDGATVSALTRLSSDGTILEFRKDSSAVGSIGTQGGDLNIGTGVCGIAFVDGVPAIYPWTTTGNTTSDAAIDLGDSAGRFKDLYLSGNIYLGGTGAANALDDYEEGTWTPSVGGNSSYHNQSGKYTKIGRTVHVTGTVQPNSLGTGSTTTVSGFPFATSNSQSGGYASGSIGFHYLLAVNVITIDMLMGHATTATAFQGKTSASQTSSSALAIFGDGARVDFAITYETS